VIVGGPVIGRVDADLLRLFEIGDQLVFEEQQPAPLLLEKCFLLLGRLLGDAMDKGVKDQVVFLHPQDGFVSIELEAGVVDSADRVEPVVERGNQRIEAGPREPQQIQRLDPEMPLHRAKIASLAEAFERQHQRARRHFLAVRIRFERRDIICDRRRREGGKALRDRAQPRLDPRRVLRAAFGVIEPHGRLWPIVARDRDPDIFDQQLGIVGMARERRRDERFRVHDTAGHPSACTVPICASSRSGWVSWTCVQRSSAFCQSCRAVAVHAPSAIMST
jgi:hypothetical protein